MTPEQVNALYAFMTDPTNPANILKRVAKRTCLECSTTFKSKTSILCPGNIFCSVKCEQKYGADMELAFEQAELEQEGW